MTRKELFEAVASHADKLQWECSLMAELGKDGSELWFRKNPPMWRVLNADTKDTDPDAAVFIIWALAWLESQEDTGGKLNPMLFRRPDGQYEVAFPDVMGRFIAPNRLDATLAAVVAVCDAMEAKDNAE